MTIAAARTPLRRNWFASHWKALLNPCTVSSALPVNSRSVASMAWWYIGLPGIVPGNTNEDLCRLPH